MGFCKHMCLSVHYDPVLLKMQKAYNQFLPVSWNLTPFQVGLQFSSFYIHLTLGFNFIGHLKTPFLNEIINQSDLEVTSLRIDGFIFFVVFLEWKFFLLVIKSIMGRLMESGCKSVNLKSDTNAVSWEVGRFNKEILL